MLYFVVLCVVSSPAAYAKLSAHRTPVDAVFGWEWYECSRMNKFERWRSLSLSRRKSKPKFWRPRFVVYRPHSQHQNRPWTVTYTYNNKYTLWHGARVYIWYHIYLIYHMYTLCMYTTINIFRGPPVMTKDPPTAMGGTTGPGGVSIKREVYHETRSPTQARTTQSWYTTKRRAGRLILPRKCLIQVDNRFRVFGPYVPRMY